MNFIPTILTVKGSGELNKVVANELAVADDKEMKKALDRLFDDGGKDDSGPNGGDNEFEGKLSRTTAE